MKQLILCSGLLLALGACGDDGDGGEAEPGETANGLACEENIPYERRLLPESCPGTDPHSFVQVLFRFRHDIDLPYVLTFLFPRFAGDKTAVSRRQRHLPCI